MILRQAILTNFRSYKKAVIDFSPGVTLITGANGKGKTNILEGVVACATARSFRAESDREMIAWNENISRIVTRTDEHELELVLTTGELEGQRVPTKKFLVDGVSKRQMDFVGVVKTVLFWPEDLELVTDSPSMRRRYLDRVLVQVDREYRRSLYSYEKALRQRNQLLDFIREGKAARHQLLFWDQLLIRTGSMLTECRAAYLQYVSLTTSNGLPYRLVYDQSVISEKRLAEYAEAEVAAGATLVGPHRDDFQFQFISQKSKVKIDNKEYMDLSKFGSRGEQRLGVLWLKMAELSYIWEKTKDRPVLLLDDIFSELDEANREMVLAMIRSQQTVITSADEETEIFLKKHQLTPQIVHPDTL
jgi:DNA replication and repair protein RecF